MALCDFYLDCRCETCKRKITLEEVRLGFHEGHEFSKSDIEALTAISDYVRSLRSITVMAAHA